MTIQNLFMFHEVAKQANGGKMSGLSAAMEELGLKGRMVKGTRLWTTDEIRQIANRLVRPEVKLCGF